MDKNINKMIRSAIFTDYSETVWVYLKGSNSKGTNYDPYRNTGQTKTNKSPEPVKAHVRQIQGNSLVAREIGLINSGAIEIVIKKSDANLFRICEKVVYNDNEYSLFKQSLGNKVQIFDSPFGFSRVILFRKGA